MVLRRPAGETSCAMKFMDRAYALFLKVANSLQSPLLLLIRLYWGWQFWQAGLGKLHDISKTIDFFTNLGIPAPTLNAYFVAWLEAVGGILLILGLGSRLIALPLVFDMIVAYVTADREALRTIFSSDNTQFLNAAEFSFLFAALIILIFGPGWFSLDTIIKWYRTKRKQSTATATST
jgi:putative oxidoreductase